MRIMVMKRKPPPGNARRVQNMGRNLRYTLTNKAGRVVQCESFQERKLALLLERDPTVRDYGSQPEQIRWIDEAGKSHAYIPDFIVWRTDNTIELHEVTLTQRQGNAHNQARQAAAQASCQTRGWTYRVHTEQNLPNDIHTANLLALYAYRSTSYCDADLTAHLLSLIAHGTHPAADVIAHLHEQTQVAIPQIYANLLHLLWHGQIETNLDRLLFRDGLLVSDCELRRKLDE
jgi:hypothetical protein